MNSNRLTLHIALALAGGVWFGEPVTAMELAPDGAGYRLNTRFARFINVPELMQLFRQMADVQTAQMLNLARPKLEGDEPNTTPLRC